MGALNKTKIDWADSTWNPITGCLHGCEYCYARGIAHRYGGCYDSVSGENIRQKVTGIQSLEHIGKVLYKTKKGKLIAAPYPYGFAPTFHMHGYRLDQPKRWKKPRTIFVCSMADLFGDWVPDEWIEEVFGVCEAAPQHRYLFLTKNPERYINLFEKGILPLTDNLWFGSTATTQEQAFWWSNMCNTFVSIEPILGMFGKAENPIKKTDWVIIGAETGNRKDKVKPKRAWIEYIAENCDATKTPLFMKSSLTKVWGEPLIQEYPWE